MIDVFWFMLTYSFYLIIMFIVYLFFTCDRHIEKMVNEALKDDKLDNKLIK